MEQENIDYFYNDLELALVTFCEHNHIEDIKKESQQVFNGFLMYCRRTLYHDKSYFKLKTPIDNGSCMKSTCNMYDFDMLELLIDDYAEICTICDKVASIKGFTYLTGIPESIIYEWNNNEFEGLPSSKGAKIYKKLSSLYEGSIQSNLETGKKNPISQIAILNRFYGWSSPYDKGDQKSGLLGSENLPKLSESGTQFQIEKK